MSHKYKSIVSILLFIPIFWGFGDANQDPAGVSIINLIAQPEKYHGRLVRVIGVSFIEFESNGLYLSKEHLINRVTKNALWMSLDWESIGKTEKELSEYNGQYILVEGIFDKEDLGHMGLKSGAIKKIKRFMPWPGLPKPIKDKSANPSLQ